MQNVEVGMVWDTWGVTQDQWKQHHLIVCVCVFILAFHCNYITNSLSCILSEIQRDWSKIAYFNLPHLHLGVTPLLVSQRSLALEN